MNDQRRPLAFQKPMDAEAIRTRLAHSNDLYALACQAAGHQGTLVDQLSWALKQCLPQLLAGLAAQVVEAGRPTQIPLATGVRRMADVSRDANAIVADMLGPVTEALERGDDPRVICLVAFEALVTGP